MIDPLIVQRLRNMYTKQTYTIKHYENSHFIFIFILHSDIRFFTQMMRQRKQESGMALADDFDIIHGPYK